MEHQALFASKDKSKKNYSVVCCIFSSPGRSPGRAIVLPPASALSGKLSYPCDRSCLFGTLRW